MTNYIAGKLVGVEIKDEKRFSSLDNQKPEYKATVRLKIGGTWITVEDVPIDSANQQLALEEAKVKLRQAITFLINGTDYIESNDDGGSVLDPIVEEE